MKPEFTKPFNIEHALAGAPYCCCEGGEATVLKWDCNHHRYPLIGVICENGFHYPESWTASGIQASDEESERRRWRDLVMLPLGMIDGKPVFVGDEVESIGSGKKIIAVSTHREFMGCRWPAPAKVYPETTCPSDILAIAYNSQQNDGNRESFARSMRAVANVALRHAIDIGQVILPDPQIQCDPFDDDPAEISFWNFDARKKGYSEWKGRPQSERDAFKAEYRKAQADRAARDIAIAEAARSACEHASYTIGGRDALDLAVIIATVK